jgi:hypothetical protein
MALLTDGMVCVIAARLATKPFVMKVLKVNQIARVDL